MISRSTVTAVVAVGLFSLPVLLQAATRDDETDKVARLEVSGSAANEQPWWEQVIIEEVGGDDRRGGSEEPYVPILRVYSFVVPSDFSFTTDSAELTDAGSTALVALVPLLTDALQIEVAGCTDPRGSESHNYNLGLARGEASVAVLVAHGVSADRLNAVSWGASQLTPRVEGQDEDEWLASNRRVVITVTTTQKYVDQRAVSASLDPTDA